MDKHVQIAVDELFEAHSASMKAHAHFMKCQATVLYKLDPETPLEDYERLVDFKFGDFIQKPSIDKASDDDFVSAGVEKIYHAPSWTLNEALDEENAKTFGPKTLKRRKLCV